MRACRSVSVDAQGPHLDLGQAREAQQVETVPVLQQAPHDVGDEVVDDIGKVRSHAGRRIDHDDQIDGFGCRQRGHCSQNRDEDPQPHSISAGTSSMRSILYSYSFSLSVNLSSSPSLRL